MTYVPDHASFVSPCCSNIAKKWAHAHTRMYVYVHIHTIKWNNMSSLFIVRTCTYAHHGSVTWIHTFLGRTLASPGMNKLSNTHTYTNTCVTRTGDNGRDSDASDKEGAITAASLDQTASKPSPKADGTATALRALGQKSVENTRGDSDDFGGKTTAFARVSSGNEGRGAAQAQRKEDDKLVKSVVPNMVKWTADDKK